MADKLGIGIWGLFNSVVRLFYTNIVLNYHVLTYQMATFFY